MNILAFIYKLITRLRNKLYDINFIKPYRSEAYVISIGNIIAGGTGKTPIIIYLAEMLQKEGYKIGIVTGGYRRKSTGLLTVHNVDNLITTVEKAGDEAYLIAKKVTCPLLIHDKKWMALKEMDNRFDLDVILIDDGFQHRKIYRDLDIVIVNQKTVDETKLIPAGLLREDKSNISRADLLLFRDIELDKRLSHNLDNFLFTSRIDKSKVTSNPAIIITAIANPSNFVNFLERSGAVIENVFAFKDHHFFTDIEINEVIEYLLKSNISTIYTTEKDLVKLERFRNIFEEKNISLLDIELQVIFDKSEEFKNYIIKKINEKHI